MNFEQPASDNQQPEKSLVEQSKDSIKKTVVIGATIAAGYMGGTSDAQAGEVASRPDLGSTQINRLEKEEKIDASFATNFVNSIKREAAGVLVDTDDVAYSSFIKEIETFSIRISTAETFSIDDQRAIRDAGIYLSSILEKTKLRIDDVVIDMQSTIDELTKRKTEGLAYGIDLAEGKQMRITQDQGIIVKFGAMKAKIDRIQAKLKEVTNK